MHHEPSPSASLSPAEEEDAATQATILTHLLELSPAQLTTDELLRELTDDPESPRHRDLIERATRDLIRAGLLHRHDAFVFPTRPAVLQHALPRP